MTPETLREPAPPSRLTALIEVVAFVAIAIISKLIVDQFIWKFSGPITLIGTLVLITIYMRFKGMKWSDMGLRGLPGWKSKLLVLPQILLVALVFAASVFFFTQALPAMGVEFMAEDAEGVNERWGNIEGNLPVYLLWLGIVWTSAAFGEEMFFRGFLITRLEAVFRGMRFAAIPAVVIPALIFGYGHFYYQGWSGLVMTGVIGLIFGSFFLIYKRNLWPLIIFHGLIDTLGMTAMYLGVDA